MTSTRLLVSPHSATRRSAALAWLSGLRATEVLVVGETLAAGHDLLLEGRGEPGASAGWRRVTLDLLASELALASLAGRIPAGGIARDAIVARTVLDLGPDRLGRLGPVSDTPGFVRAVGRALEELRLAGIEGVGLTGLDDGLAALAAGVEREWESAGLADRATTLRAATSAVRDPTFEHYLLGHAVLFHDLGLRSRLEAEFARALAARASGSLVTVPGADLATRAAFAEAAPFEWDEEPAGEDRALRRLQAHLFAPPPEQSESDESLTVFSAPGESRECVEIARRLLELAADGKGFDRAAILLRQPGDYRPYLEEALDRANIPAWYARGARRPDTAGRAFLALLRCREENYSALRFAEYLSIGEVPQPGDDRAEGTVRRPRRWEQLLVESSVVGGLNRWERRLDSLREEFEIKRDGLVVEDPDDPRIGRLDGSLVDLERLREYALPLLSELAALPEACTWLEWIDALDALAARSVAHPERIQATLAALAPMGPVGPTTLGEVVRTLGPRLLEVTRRSDGSRYGKVFVAPIDSARGLSFDVVFVPGMAERVFPPKISEDPILLDHIRGKLNAAAETPGLRTNVDRVADERLALSIAVGAAREQVVLSYPRIEAGKSRPRVPSFYMLEAVRAGEGTLPRFEALAESAGRLLATPPGPSTRPSTISRFWLTSEYGASRR
jgi:hypothetical protein